MPVGVNECHFWDGRIPLSKNGRERASNILSARVMRCGNLALENVFQRPARFWLNQRSSYRSHTSIHGAMRWAIISAPKAVNSAAQTSIV